jgi:hypothetical protein
VVRNAWPAFASLSWAMVMYLFRWHPENVQPSLRSSMHYMWVQAFHLEEEGRLLTAVADMYNQITGIRYEALYGTINRHVREATLEWMGGEKMHLAGVTFLYMVIFVIWLHRYLHIWVSC